MDAVNTCAGGKEGGRGAEREEEGFFYDHAGDVVMHKCTHQRGVRLCHLIQQLLCGHHTQLALAHRTLEQRQVKEALRVLHLA